MIEGIRTRIERIWTGHRKRAIAVGGILAALAIASAALLAGTATVASAAGAQSAHSHGLRGGAHSNARIHDEPRIGCGLDDGGAGGTGGNGGSGGTGRTG